MTSEHRRHDRLLIARFAGDDAYVSERAEAEKLVASCAECAALAADIRLLALRTADMQAPRRPRDFRLSTEQAETVRGSWLERALRRLAAPGLGTLRPVAGAAFALGLTMTVVGALPMSDGAASPGQDDGASVRLPAASAAMEQQQPLASGLGVPGGEVPPGEAPAEGEIRSEAGTPMPMTSEMDDVYLRGDGSGEAFAGSDAQPAATSSALVYSGLLIATGALAVLLLAVVARRRFADPLLR